MVYDGRGKLACSMAISILCTLGFDAWFPAIASSDGESAVCGGTANRCHTILLAGCALYVLHTSDPSNPIQIASLFELYVASVPTSATQYIDLR